MFYGCNTYISKEVGCYRGQGLNTCICDTHMCNIEAKNGAPVIKNDYNYFTNIIIFICLNLIIH